MKTVRAMISDEEYEELTKYIDFHGEISYIIRKAIKSFLEAKRGEKGGNFERIESRRRRRPKKGSETNTRRGELR